MPDHDKGFLIINRTKATDIGYADMANSFKSRFMGLMFKGSIERGLVLKIPPGRGRHGSGIHMFFMRIPLDIIFLDSRRIVVDLVSIEPWKTYTPKKPAKYIIEMKEGSISASKTEIGDQVDFTCEMV